MCFRVNDLRLKGGKRSIKPIEIMSEMKTIREEINENPGSIENELHFF